MHKIPPVRLGQTVSVRKPEEGEKTDGETQTAEDMMGYYLDILEGKVEEDAKPEDSKEIFFDKESRDKISTNGKRRMRSITDDITTEKHEKILRERDRRRRPTTNFEASEKSRDVPNLQETNPEPDPQQRAVL